MQSPAVDLCYQVIWERNPRKASVKRKRSEAGKERRPMHACMLSCFSHDRLCELTDCSPRGSSVLGILQARTLEWVTISFSNA